METARDRMWIWGHEAGSHREEVYGTPGPSRMTPLEGAVYLGVPNLIMVRYEDKPEMPFDQYALAFRPLKQVYWSTVGGAGATSQAEREHVLGLARRFPNIVGIFMDDFFADSQRDGDLGVLSLEEIRAMKGEMRSVGRPMRLGVTLYTHQLGMPLGPYLDECDDVSLWTWRAPDQANLDANLERCEVLAPTSDKLLGLYMWDYGRKQPVPLDLMEMQCTKALQWLQEDRIRGMIFLASCICDLEIEAVEWSRAWIAKVGDEVLLG